MTGEGEGEEEEEGLVELAPFSSSSSSAPMMPTLLFPSKRALLLRFLPCCCLEKRHSSRAVPGETGRCLERLALVFGREKRELEFGG